MDKYFVMIRMRFLTMLAYRMEYYTGIIIYSINIGAYYFLWKAIYGSQGEIGNVDFVQMTTYVAIGWMARSFYYNNIDREIAADIQEGKVAIELIRPYDYVLMKTAQAFGEGVFRFFCFAVPGFIIVSLLFPVHLPSDPFLWVSFFVSIFFSFLIFTQINLAVGLTTFFFYNNRGFMRAKRILLDLLSGLLIPIYLFPAWVQSIFTFLPFQSISYVPSMIFSGGFTTELVYLSIGKQLLWSVILIVPIMLLWKTAKKNCSGARRISICATLSYSCNTVDSI